MMVDLGFGSVDLGILFQTWVIVCALWRSGLPAERILWSLGIGSLVLVNPEQENRRER